MVYPIFKIWFTPLFAIFTGRIEGAENIPNKTPFIVVSNHERLIDPVFISYPLVKKLNKKIHFLANPRWWFLGEKICRQWAGCVPLFDPKQAYKEMKELIESSEIVGIFPEGRLTKKARLENPKTGAVRLAIETKTPILPIGLKSSFIPFNSTLNIGKPIYLKKSKKGVKKQIQDLMKYIYTLRNAKI